MSRVVVAYCSLLSGYIDKFWRDLGPVTHVTIGLAVFTNVYDQERMYGMMRQSGACYCTQEE
jgi:hypothetical protein